jgi:hypothetical protein
MPVVDLAEAAAKVAAAAAASKPPPSDDEPGFFERLTAPLSVAVGLVFFAMGVMIGLTIEGRGIHLSVSLPAATVSAPVPVASTPAGPTHPAGLSATPGPAASSAVPTDRPPSTPPSNTKPPAGPPGKPPGKPQGTGKLPPIIFGGG